MIRTFFAVFIILFVIGCIKEVPNPRFSGSVNEKDIRSFVDSIVNELAPLEKELASTQYAAWDGGSDDDYKRAADLETAYRLKLSDKEKFTKLREYRKRNIKDALLKREVEVLYLMFLENQLDKDVIEELVKRSNAIEKKFNTFRAKIDEKEVTMNDVKDIMRTSKDRKLREKAYLAQKSIGKEIGKEIQELMNIRNYAANKIGFKDFYEYRLAIQELDKGYVINLFENLVNLTEEPFKNVKKEIDDMAASNLGIKPEELMPWDYFDPFFQEAPEFSELNLDNYFKKLDLVKVSTDFYKTLSMDPTDILERSSLFEKPRKNPHAFEMSVDRMNDIRILCNLKNDYDWMTTLIHELGHALYDKYIQKDLPWLLRTPASSFTTEGIAQLFERAVNKDGFLKKYVGMSDEERAKFRYIFDKQLRFRQLVFLRWSAVMVNFEAQAYSNPDQNLNKLWWDLVERYQHIKRIPGRDEPDYASKIHVATVPVYYHNYIIGELYGSQLLFAIAAHINKKPGIKEVKVEDVNRIDFTDSPEIGLYVRQKVFGPGASLNWKDFVKFSTGEELSPEYFAKQFF
ncbi:MAG: M2 family metallopeptidase [Deltaproteobacteria bacterium]|nr:M2 family metallopeptidase [Deltaproteobacteria bacterium]